MMNEKNMKCCVDCKTTKTPLWRGGPAGPKSLCNACGIRYRKQKRVIEGLSRRPEKKKVKKTHSTSASASGTSPTNSTTNTVNTIAAEEVDNNGGLSESFKIRLIALGKQVMSQRSPSPSSAVIKKQRCQRKRKLKEEEQAAFSLMALSCGSVFA